MTARRSLPSPAPAAPFDTAPWDAWFEQQRNWFDGSLDQWTRNQQVLASAWYQWLDGFAALWRLTPWPAVPAPPQLQALWGPWTPFLARGGEELG
ncbi:MAG: hypothetical protein KF788_21280 [Piscinibacter sp.]|nr:hypothetical protein [Piscinibacter sp.]